MLGSDLLACWDAERTDLITIATGVSSWRDIVGDYNAAQGTGSLQPIWSATSFGGGAGVAFDGVDDQLTLTLAGQLPETSVPGEIWVLVSQDSIDAVARTAISYGATNTTNLRTIQKAQTLLARTSVGDGSASISVATLRQDFTSRHVVRMRLGQSGLFISQNRIPFASSISVIPSTLGTRLRIGALPAVGAANFWQGQVALVLMTKPLPPAKVNALYPNLISRRRA